MENTRTPASVSEQQTAAFASELVLIEGEDNPDDDIDFAWRPFRVIEPPPRPPSDGCRTCHRPWTECEC